MEDEIDLRQYFDVLIRQWKWIVGLTVLAAAVALGVSFLIPPTYEATALVVVTRPRYQLQFDPRIETLTQPQQPYKAYPELAASDDLVAQVVAATDGRQTAEDRELSAFRERLSAEAGADPSLVRLTASSDDPQQAQAVANTWAGLYVSYVNELYQQRSSDVAFFETQVAEANTTLEKAEQALVDFQARNPIVMVTLELSSTQMALTDYLAAQRTIALVTQDARSLQQQLAAQNAGDPAALADELSALYLQVDALSTQTAAPIQLQIAGGGSLANRTVGEQTALLEALIQALQNKSAEIQQAIDALQPDILTLQQQQQQAQTELDRLTRDRDVANETYLTLTRKLDEARVAAQSDSGEVQLASQASVPDEPASPRKGLNTVLGGILGFLVGIVAAFVVDARKPMAQASHEPAVPVTVER